MPTERDIPRAPIPGAGPTVFVPVEHSAVTAGMLWFALREALTMLGERHYNDGWREELYDRTMRLLEEGERNPDADEQRRLAEAGMDTSLAARRSAYAAIEAAFDRIVVE